MKAYIIIGMLLLLISIVAFSYEGIKPTDDLKVAGFEPMHNSIGKPRELPPAVLIGTISVVGGIALLVIWIAKN